MASVAVTRLDLFTVPTRAAPRALARMATDRRRLARARPGFWKLLGTVHGRTFDVRDADPRRWGVLTVWWSSHDADAFGAGSAVIGGWRRLADEHWWVTLRTVRVVGQWSRRQPFGDPHRAAEQPFGDPHRAAEGPVAVLTRARLRWSRASRFYRSVAPVNRDLDRADGLRLRLGIGEAPLGLQGTFSLWDSPAAMQAFAYRGVRHRDVIRRSGDERWYAEELFARFALVDHGGTIFGTDPLER